jgi:hypothetical protein
MPTGYTWSIKEGKVTSLKQFAMECARAFGACAELRDDMTALIPEEFKPSDYHSKELAKARRDLTKAKAMTLEEAEAQSMRDYQHGLEEDRKYKEDKVETKKSYQAMIAQVKEWKPPTKEHVGLKEFMLQQLNDSIEHDCIHYPREKREKLSALRYRAQQIVDAEEDIKYHEKEYAEEVERCRKRTQWIRDLRISLGI